MKYSIEFSREGESDLDDLYHADRSLFRRVLNKIESLSDCPREGKLLVGNHKGQYFLRIGRYRVVYELDISRQIVFVLTIKHRKHV